jgi:hypothetical protein
MTEIAPPEHVPADQTGWVRLGAVTAGHCPIAIVSADVAAGITRQWHQRREASWNTHDRQEQEELLMTGSQQTEEITVTWPVQDVYGTETDSAVMFSTELPAAGIVEGKFGDVYGTGHMQLTEIRVRLWTCSCVCHDDQDIDEADACDGYCCHDDR